MTPLAISILENKD